MSFFIVLCSAVFVQAAPRGDAGLIATDDRLKAMRSSGSQMAATFAVAQPRRSTAPPSQTGGATSVPEARTAAERPKQNQPAVRTDGRRVVALDIGHTVQHSGAISATGATEFSFNKRIVNLLFVRLKTSSRIAPFVINPSGAPITLPERTRLAAARGAELFLSIHHDSVQKKYLIPWTVAGQRLFYADDFRGYGVFVSQKNPEAARSLEFARLLGGEMAKQGFEFSPHHSEPVPGENRPIIDKYNGVYRYDDLIVLKTARMPAALLECGVIINRSEEKLLNEPATHHRIADAVVTAIERFFVDRAAK